RRRLEQLPNRRVPTTVAAPVYGRLLGIESAVDLQPEELRRQTFEALVDLLEAMAASSNLLLCVEDVDAADASTLELLRALLARAGRRGPRRASGRQRPVPPRPRAGGGLLEPPGGAPRRLAPADRRHPRGALRGRRPARGGGPPLRAVGRVRPGRKLVAGGR